MMKKNESAKPNIFQRHQSTLKDTSYNDAGTAHMTDSLLPVINFDAVKSEYIRSIIVRLFQNQMMHFCIMVMNTFLLNSKMEI